MSSRKKGGEPPLDPPGRTGGEPPEPPLRRIRWGFRPPTTVPLGIPPPYDGYEPAQATEGGGGVGVPPPYDGYEPAQATSE